MRVTDRLKVEHGVFLKQLKVVENLLDVGASMEVVRGAVAAIAMAENHHAQIEDKLLYPALAKVLANPEKVLAAVSQDHAQMQELASRALQTLSGTGEPLNAEEVRRYVKLTRDHLEREIHGVFPVAEEFIPAAELESMASWHTDHMYEEMGREAPWKQPR